MNDPTLLMFAHQALGDTLADMGDFRLAEEHLEATIALCGHERQRALGVDMEVVARSYAARNIWFLGYPEQALRRGEEAIAVAQALSDPFSLVFAAVFVSNVQQRRGEARASQESAERVITLCREHGFVYWRAHTTVYHGLALADQGRGEEGLIEIQEGFAAAVATGAEVNRPDFFCWLGQAYWAAGSLDEALRALTKALAVGNEHGHRFFEAENHRLKGELLLRINDSNFAEAHLCFERAIEIARQQCAKSWELRSTTSLARLLATQDRHEEALTMLAEIYNWFTEGFDTADLKDAKTLIDELRA